MSWCIASKTFEQENTHSNLLVGVEFFLKSCAEGREAPTSTMEDAIRFFFLCWFLIFRESLNPGNARNSQAFWKLQKRYVDSWFASSDRDDSCVGGVDFVMSRFEQVFRRWVDSWFAASDRDDSCGRSVDFVLSWFEFYFLFSEKMCSRKRNVSRKQTKTYSLLVDSNIYFLTMLITKRK